jgi:exopolyphosphatase/guanosine-5'-triphosphate,3'-diphosphate pyrophosphatase
VSAERPTIIGAIDVGTNSIKMTVGKLGPGGVETLHFMRATTRLGRALETTGEIDDPGRRETSAAIERFAHAARQHGATSVLAFSTYALRSAANGESIARSMTRRTGVDLRVLTGRDEARLAYLSARQAVPRRAYALVVDAGGGSTEYALGRGDDIEVARSIRLGALHLTERYQKSDPIATNEYGALTKHIRVAADNLVRALPTPTPRFDLIASGGSAATAAWMAHGSKPGDSTGERLKLAELRALLAACRGRTVAERRQLPGLPADRADIILAGLAIIVGLMERMGKRVVWINEGGVREGALIHLAGNNLRW